MKHTIQIEAMHSLRLGELLELERKLTSINTSDILSYAEGSSDTDEQVQPYSIIDGTAIIRIDGPLLSTPTRFSRVLGYTSYPEIRSVAIHAANNPSVQDILLVVGSPGGSVFGITDGADAIRKVDSIKPVYVYSNKNCCSGAYWLASAAREIITSPEAEVGSIGVIVTHFSYEKQLEEDGIKVTLLRSSELKAIGGPYKDLTDKEINHIQSQVDQYNDLFQEHVRSKRPGVRLSSMKGETYIGQEAVRMGLVDAIMSYDQTIDYIKGKRKVTTQTGGYKMKMTAEELRTALDAGATLESLGLTEEDVAEIQASVKEPEVQEPETKEPVAVDVEALQAQIAELTAKVVESEAALVAAQEVAMRSEADTKMIAEMKEIICGVMNSRRIAMKLPKVDFSAFSAESLLGDYKAVTAQYDEAFKTGGLFAKKVEEKKPVVAKDSVHVGLLGAAA